MALNDSEQIYIVITQTGTILSRMLKVITGAEYNHVSLGFREDLKCTYSFGRLNAYNAFYGGFVVESVYHGTFKRFKNTKAMLLSLKVPPEKKREMTEYMSEIIKNRKSYHYNYRAFFLAPFHISLNRDKYFYCSEFVRDFLRRFGVEGAEGLPEIVEPMHFLNIPNSTVIYQGKLHDYVKEKTAVNL